MTFRTSVLAVTMVVGAAGCLGAATAPEPQRFVGFYTSGFEVEAFRPCGLDEVWWVTAAPALRERYREVATSPYEPMLAVVRGEVTPLGRYGHLTAYDRELTVLELLEAPAERQADCD